MWFAWLFFLPCFGVGGCLREGVARRPWMAGGMGTDGSSLTECDILTVMRGEQPHGPVTHPGGMKDAYACHLLLLRRPPESTVPRTTIYEHFAPERCHIRVAGQQWPGSQETRKAAVEGGRAFVSNK